MKVMTLRFTDVNRVTAQYEGTTFHDYGADVYEHIDYCFIDKGIEAKEYRVMDDKADRKYPSDHYGLFFALDVK